MKVQHARRREGVVPFPATYSAVIDAQYLCDDRNTASTIDELRGSGYRHAEVLAFSTLKINQNVEGANPRVGRIEQNAGMENVAKPGDRLRTLRELRKLDQVEVAVAVGIARSTLAGIEAGHNPPGRKTLMALADFYGVSLDWLATGQGGMIAGKATAQTEDEALLLFAYRQMPEDESKPLLQMMLSRAGKSAS